MVQKNAARQPKSHNYPELDGIRGVASFIVAFAHYFYFYYDSILTGRSTDSVGRLVASSPFALLFNGQFSVWIFFALSGFVLAFATENSSLSTAALVIKRYLRLTIPIAAATLLAFILVRMGLGDDAYRGQFTETMQNYFPAAYAPSISDWIKESLFLIYYTGHSDLNGVLWTMQIELVGSICVFLIFRLIRPKSLRIAVNVVATALFFLLLDNHDNFQGLQLFCCGMIIYDIQPFLMSSLKSDRVRNAVGLPLIVFGVAVAMWWVKRPELPSVQPLLVLLGLGRFQARQIAAVLTVLGVILAPKAKRFLSLPLFQFLGAISFPLYLVHSTIEVLLSGWPLVFLGGQMGELAAGALTLVATIGFSLIVSVVFLRLVERPAIQISSRVAKRFDMFKLNWRTA